MPVDPSKTVYYRRARFTTRLPKTYRYALSHFWLEELEPELFRIGITHFATRMLGDFVECEFQKSASDNIDIGLPLGWIEGFKAVSDIYSVIEGEFVESNVELAGNPQFMDRDPYDRGWLYIARGKPDSRVVDCQGYVEALDLAIDRILSQEQEQQKKC
ncbi:MAG: glycine cleavage system protein H [Planctomycetota bacterium]|nr:glycine cleavage system protein H [Planctomycetota bacterium]